MSDREESVKYRRKLETVRKSNRRWGGFREIKNERNYELARVNKKEISLKIIF